MLTNEAELETSLPCAALILDDAFPYGAEIIAERIKQQRSPSGLIYVDSDLNVFRVLHLLELGFCGYLYLGDDLSCDMREAVRRKERFFSPQIAALYRRYWSYRGLFEELPRALKEIFMLMGEELTVQDIRQRSGLSESVIYRRQYRLRQYFGVASNAELLDIMRSMYASC